MYKIIYYFTHRYFRREQFCTPATCWIIKPNTQSVNTFKSFCKNVFALCRLLSIFASLRHKIYSSEDLNGFGKLADSFEKSHHIFFLYDGKEFFSEAVVQRKGARIPRFERKGDKDAKEILVKHNLRLVAHIAKNTPTTATTTNLYQSVLSGL